MNKIIKILIFSDIFFNGGWGLIGPIFAVFLINNIQGGDIKVVGFAAAIYWIVKSCVQVPIAKYLDKNDGEKDDFIFMVMGLFLTGFVPFGYLFSCLPWHIYALQAVYAVGMAMAVPPWLAIFTRHIDKRKEAYEWSIYSTSLGFAVGLSGAAGAMVVDAVGFKIIYVFVGTFTIISAMSLLLIQKEIVLSRAREDKIRKIIPPGTYI